MEHLTARCRSGSAVEGSEGNTARLRRDYLVEVDRLREALGVPDSISLSSLPLRPHYLFRNQQLYSQGDPASDIYVLLFGTLKAVRLSKEGDEGVLSFYYPGDVLWTDGFHCNERALTVTAMEPSAVFTLPYAGLQQLMACSGPMQARFYEALSRTINEQRKHIALLARASAEHRVCDFLLQVVERRPGRDLTLELPMSRSDIASYLGLSTETISRVLNKLQATGVIHTRGRHVDISKLSSLQALAPRGPRGRTGQAAPMAVPAKIGECEALEMT